jgi:5-methylcytosine-specific restriction endonuclease McrA
MIRADHHGPHRAAYEKNKKIVLRTQKVCAICGQPVDKKLKWPDPRCATVDHVIPINKGGHPSDLANLQLAHFFCNRQKSDRLTLEEHPVENRSSAKINNRDLPLTLDWANHRSKK